MKARKRDWQLGLGPSFGKPAVDVVIEMNVGAPYEFESVIWQGGWIMSVKIGEVEIPFPSVAAREGDWWVAKDLGWPRLEYGEKFVVRARVDGVGVPFVGNVFGKLVLE